MNKRFLYSGIGLVLFVILVIYPYDTKLPESWDDIKKDFFIMTKKLSDFEKNIELLKVWKIDSDQNIDVISTISWKVKDMYLKSGDYIEKWQTLVVIDDSTSHYGLEIKRAKNNIESFRLEYDSQKNILEKDIFDSEKFLQDLENRLDDSKKMREKNIEKIENNLSDLNNDNRDSKIFLDIEKIDNQILKWELDYENKKILDMEQVNWFILDATSYGKTFSIMVDDIFNFWDNVFDITWKYKNNNDYFIDFLWAKNANQKKLTISHFRDLLHIQKKYSTIKIDDLNVIEKLNEIKLDIDFVEKTLKNSEETFNNSIDSIWTLSKTDIDNYVSQINIFQSGIDDFRNSFISSKWNIDSFLKTYKRNWESIDRELALAKKDKEILLKQILLGQNNTKLDLDSEKIISQAAIKWLENEIDKAKYSLDFQTINKKITLQKLENAIESAQISLDEANNNYNKLFIKSPISWEITDILFDIWDTLDPGDIILNIVSTWEKEIRISFNEHEISKIKKWWEVKIVDENNSYNGFIYSVSNIADKNLNYNAVIKLFDDVNIIWKLVTIKIEVENNKILLPLSIVEITLDEWIWIINTYGWSTYKKHKIDVWNIWWKKIEIESTHNNDLEVITTNMDFFDTEKFNLKIKNTNEK